jgi:glycosyltransferase involved in cell wall biosynthesis
LKSNRPKIGIVVSPDLAMTYGTRSAEEHTIFNLGKMLSDEFQLDLVGGWHLSERLNSNHKNFNYTKIRTFEQGLLNGLMLPIRAVNTFMYALRQKPDVLIQLGGIGTNGLIVTVVGKLTRTPSVAREAGDVFNMHKFGDTRWESAKFFIKNILLGRVSFTLASRVICVGEQLAISQASHGVSRDKIRVIPGPLSVDRFLPPDDKDDAKKAVDYPTDKRVMLHVGAFHNDKGGPNLVGIIESTLAKTKDAFFVVIGRDGSADKRFEKRLEQFPKENVRLIPPILHSEIVPYFQGADVFVLPSFAGGGFSQAGLEALACHVPVVTMNPGLDVSATYSNNFDTTEEFADAIVTQRYKLDPIPDFLEPESLKKKYIEFFNELVRD